MLSDGSADDERFLSRVLVEEQVVCGDGSNEQGGRSRSNMVVVPLESREINLGLDLGDGTLLGLGQLGGNEWLDII